MWPPNLRQFCSFRSGWFWRCFRVANSGEHYYVRLRPRRLYEIPRLSRCALPASVAISEPSAMVSTKPSSIRSATVRLGTVASDRLLATRRSHSSWPPCICSCVSLMTPFVGTAIPRCARSSIHANKACDRAYAMGVTTFNVRRQHAPQLGQTASPRTSNSMESLLSLR